MQKNRGFTLVELSIVLVILGLLVGGVLTGKSLIRAAEIRSFSTDFQRYQTAIAAFRDKYFALPGDFGNATAFWGSLGGTGADATCQNLTASGAPTCNGNGNGDINTSIVANDERYRAWQHLAAAGLIEGSYSGRAGPDSAAHYIGGTNVPSSRLGNNSTHIITGGPGRFVSSGATAFGGAWGLTTEVRTTVSTSGAYLPVVAPEELWNIDTKLDDGRPATGIIVTYKNAAFSAVTSTCLINEGSADTAAYNLAEPSKQCVVIAIITR